MEAVQSAIIIIIITIIITLFLSHLLASSVKELTGDKTHRLHYK